MRLTHREEGFAHAFYRAREERIPHQMGGGKKKNARRLVHGGVMYYHNRVSWVGPGTAGGGRGSGRQVSLQYGSRQGLVRPGGRQAHSEVGTFPSRSSTPDPLPPGPHARPNSARTPTTGTWGCNQPQASSTQHSQKDTLNKVTRIHTHIHTHARAHTHTHTHAHTRAHTHTHARTHTRTHTHTHTPYPSPSCPRPRQWPEQQKGCVAGVGIGMHTACKSNRAAVSFQAPW